MEIFVASVPSIDIDYSRGPDPYKKLDSNGFRDFVYWVLLNKPLVLNSFRLWCAKHHNMSTIRQWIHAAVNRKVKLLDLMFCPKKEYEIIELPQCLVTCGSLEVLRLCLIGRRLFLPKFTGFRALRVLELNEVELFKDGILKYFLDSCPSLEDLSLIDCSAYYLFITSLKLKNLRIDTRELVTDEEDDYDVDCRMCYSLEISCPKLEFLKLTGYVAMEFVLKNLYSLKKAMIHPEDLCMMEASPFELFASISHVESLSISLYCISVWFDPKVDAPISLPNLKTLELTVDGSNIDVLIPFLKCLPDLESLHLTFPKDVYHVEKWKLDEAATISILTRHLKKVEFLEFDEEKTKLVVARALLEHGNELEEMVFSWGDGARFHMRSTKIINE